MVAETRSHPDRSLVDGSRVNIFLRLLETCVTWVGRGFLVSKKDAASRLIQTKDLSEFFRDEVKEASGNLGVEISDLSEFYVVNLLCEVSKAGGRPLPGDEPLALIYKRALESSLADRMRLLKHLGDAALTMAGLFSEFIERSLVDMDYYVSMGGNAYGNLSDIMGTQPRGETFAEVYGTLAVRFTTFVDILTQVADGFVQLGDHSDLLKVYDRWNRTGSARAHKLLLQRGLIFSAGHEPKEFDE